MQLVAICKSSKKFLLFLQIYFHGPFPISHINFFMQFALLTSSIIVFVKQFLISLHISFTLLEFKHISFLHTWRCYLKSLKCMILNIILWQTHVQTLSTNLCVIINVGYSRNEDYATHIIGKYIIRIYMYIHRFVHKFLEGISTLKKKQLYRNMHFKRFPDV